MGLHPYTGTRAARRARAQLAQGDACANTFALGQLLARSPQLAEAFAAGLAEAAVQPNANGDCSEAVQRSFGVLDYCLKNADD